MVVATSISLSLSLSLSPSHVASIFNPKPRYSINAQNQLPASFPSPRTNNYTHTHLIPLHTNRIWRISAIPAQEFFILEVNAPENSEQLATTISDDWVSTIISLLLFVAFVGLSILTIGVIYIAVTDYLQKREKEKFEKEEAAKAKKGGKKRKVRARAGPKGFGQKIDEDDFDV